MPNPKTGTVTMDVAKAVTEIKGGKIEFRVDKHANLHFIIGKASFSDQQLVENYAAALEEILRLKPSASKGRYIAEGDDDHDDGPGHPGGPEPHPQPAGGGGGAGLSLPLLDHDEPHRDLRCGLDAAAGGRFDPGPARAVR